MAEARTTARRYARAAFRAARNRERVGEFADELAAVGEALARDEVLLRLWASPAVPLERKRELLQRGIDELGETLSDECKRLLDVLARNGRLGVVGDILREYRAMADEDAGRVQVAVSVARELEEGQREHIEKALSSKMGKEVVMTVVEDASLLGGLTVRVGDLMYDASAKGRLNRVLRRLTT